jgi:hypothetical protein
MSNDHGGGCVCYSCSSQREMDRQSEHQGVAWENNGSGHSASCSCWSCDGRKQKRHNDIENKYPRRW